MYHIAVYVCFKVKNVYKIIQMERFTIKPTTKIQCYVDCLCVNGV